MNALCRRACFVSLFTNSLCFALFSATCGTACAQIVADGATNTLSNVTTNITGDVTVGTNGAFTLLVLSDNALLTNSGSGTIGSTMASFTPVLRCEAGSVTALTLSSRRIRPSRRAGLSNRAGRSCSCFRRTIPHIEGGRNPIKRFEESMVGTSESAKERFYAENFAELMG